MSCLLENKFAIYNARREPFLLLHVTIGSVLETKKFSRNSYFPFSPNYCVQKANLRSHVSNKSHVFQLRKMLYEFFLLISNEQIYLGHVCIH
jgi:hypothetical protein